MRTIVLMMMQAIIYGLGRENKQHVLTRENIMMPWHDAHENDII